MRTLVPLAFLLLACSSPDDTAANTLSKSNAAGRGGSKQSSGGNNTGGSGKGTSGTSGQSGLGGSNQAGTGGFGGWQVGGSTSGTSGYGGVHDAGAAGSSGQAGNAQAGNAQAGNAQAGNAQAGNAQAGSGGGVDPFEEYRQHCVDEINMYRATINLPPYERWKEGEACADQMASYDANKNSAHAGFKAGICSPKGSGQNECPGYGSPTQLDGCLAQMWAEGPSSDGEWDYAHGHYQNMVGQYTVYGNEVHFTRVACGFSDKGWFLQNFQ